MRLVSVCDAASRISIHIPLLQNLSLQWGALEVDRHLVDRRPGVGSDGHLRRLIPRQPLALSGLGGVHGFASQIYNKCCFV